MTASLRRMQHELTSGLAPGSRRERRPFESDAPFGVTKSSRFGLVKRVICDRHAAKVRRVHTPVQTSRGVSDRAAPNSLHRLRSIKRHYVGTGEWVVSTLDLFPTAESGMKSRTSCAQRQAPAFLAAHCSASSREGTSTTQNPPIASGYGPSVTVPSVATMLGADTGPHVADDDQIIISAACRDQPRPPAGCA
jgi:hypothetical protein